MSSHDQPPMVVPPYSSHVPSLLSAAADGLWFGDGAGKQDLREYLHILLKRKWWIIGTFLSIFLAGGALYFYSDAHLPHHRDPADHPR